MMSLREGFGRCFMLEESLAHLVITDSPKNNGEWGKDDLSDEIHRGTFQGLHNARHPRPNNDKLTHRDPSQEKGSSVFWRHPRVVLHEALSDQRCLLFEEVKMSCVHGGRQEIVNFDVVGLQLKFHMICQLFDGRLAAGIRSHSWDCILCG